MEKNKWFLTIDFINKLNINIPFTNSGLRRYVESNGLCSNGSTLFNYIKLLVKSGFVDKYDYGLYIKKIDIPYTLKISDTEKYTKKQIQLGLKLNKIRKIL